MKKNHTRPVGIDDGPGLYLGPDPGIGSAREIKEGIGEEPVVGKTIERRNGIQGILTGHIGVEPTGRAVRAGMEEGAWASTAPWRNVWVFDIPRASSIQYSPSKRLGASNSLFVGKPSPRFFFASNPPTLSDRVSSLPQVYPVLDVHAISSLLDSIYLRFCDAHLQNLYIMVIISSYLTIYLRCSATQSLCLCYLVSSLLSRVCESLDPSRLVSNCIDIDVRLSCRCCHHPCFTNAFAPSSLPSPISHLPHTCLLVSLFSMCILLCLLSLFVSYTVSPLVGSFTFRFHFRSFCRTADHFAYNLVPPTLTPLRFILPTCVTPVLRAVPPRATLAHREAIVPLILTADRSSHR